MRLNGAMHAIGQGDLALSNWRVSWMTTGAPISFHFDVGDHAAKSKCVKQLWPRFALAVQNITEVCCRDTEFFGKGSLRASALNISLK